MTGLVFADTLYWLAITKPGDPYAGRARDARSILGAIQLITTEAVLAEFLNAFSKAIPRLRAHAAHMARTILNSQDVLTIPVDTPLFSEALRLFESRADKNYSMVDCISMVIMKRQRINRVLTNDHGFQQEGYTILIV